MELLRRLAGLISAGAVLAFAPSAAGQVASEAAVKAAFLYKFAGYIEWPAKVFSSPEAPLVLATMNADDVAAELEAAVAGRAVNARRIVVRRLKAGEQPQDVHLLFIGRREPNPRAALRAAAQLGVLTVTETSLETGGAINFVVADERVGFEVSLDAAERGGHKISSRMLAVARRVLPKAAL